MTAVMDVMEEIVNSMLENINSQRQLLIEQKQLLLQHQEGSHRLPNVDSSTSTFRGPVSEEVNKMPNKMVSEYAQEKLFQHCTTVSADAHAVKKTTNTEILSRKPVHSRTSKQFQQNCSSSLSQSSLPPIAYTVVGGKLVATSTSPFTVYESIIAKYKRQENKLPRPTSVRKTKLASISLKKAQLEAEFSSSKVLGSQQSSQKKPAFFVRKSDALHRMLPAVAKHEENVIEVDEDDKVDPDLEIFASMTKQAKVVTAEPIISITESTRFRRQSFASIDSIGTFSESGQTRASLDPRMAKKVMSAIPKYDLLFPPAPSVPFLPTKTRRTSTPLAKQNSTQGAMLAAAVAAQSPDQGIIRPESYYSKRMDVIVIVEHCCDCEQHCTQSLRHDAKKYVQMANDVLYSIIEFISSSSVNSSSGDDHYPVRLFCMRTKPLTPDRIGAFEVTVAVNITPPIQPPAITATQQLHQHYSFSGSNGASLSNLAPMKGGSPGSLLRRNDTMLVIPTSIVDEKQPVVDSVWATNLIYSKLQTKCWPSVEAIEKKVEQFLSAVLNSERGPLLFHNSIQQITSILQTGDTSSEEDILKERDAAKVRAIEDSYSKWVDRMRIPPKVEKHNLDLEWPDTPMGKKASALPTTLADTNRKEAIQHPPGPYIEFKLSDQLPKTDFESAVLRHFEVLDSVKIDHDEYAV